MKKILGNLETTLLGVIVGSIATVFIYFYIKQFPGGISPEHSRWAEFGTFFGGVLGALFSFTAVLILLRTLEVNKKELVETRAVLEKQIFETTYLQLLNQIDIERSKIDRITFTHQSYETINIEKLLNHTDDYLQYSGKAGLIAQIGSIILSITNLSSHQQLLNLVKIVLLYLAESISDSKSQELYIQLFLNKLPENYLVFFIFYYLAYKKDDSVTEVIKTCKLSDYIENDQSKYSLNKLTE